MDRNALIPRNLHFSERFLVLRLNTSSIYVSIIISDDFLQASADGVINAASVLSHNS